jgi:TonB family protein
MKNPRTTWFAAQLVVIGLTASLATSAQQAGSPTGGYASIGEWSLRRLAATAPMPEYPRASVARRVSGVVVAIVTFGPDGRLSSIEILESPDADTAQSVRDAVGRWHVPPVQQLGGGRSLRDKLTFYFRFEDGRGRVLNPDQMPGAMPPPRPIASGATGSPTARAGASMPVVRGGHGEGLATVTVEVFKPRAAERPHVVVDIGSREAFGRGHWPGAVNIPWDELRVRAGPELPRARTVVIDCTQEDLAICRFAGGYVTEQGFGDVVLLVR